MPRATGGPAGWGRPHFSGIRVAGVKMPHCLPCGGGSRSEGQQRSFKQHQPWRVLADSFHMFSWDWPFFLAAEKEGGGNGLGVFELRSMPQLPSECPLVHAGRKRWCLSEKKTILDGIAPKGLGFRLVGLQRTFRAQTTGDCFLWADAGFVPPSHCVESVGHGSDGVWMNIRVWTMLRAQPGKARMLGRMRWLRVQRVRIRQLACIGRRPGIAPPHSAGGADVPGREGSEGKKCCD
jgi:hypothetical protein